MNNDELLSTIEFLRNTMVSVSTGGPRIQDVNEQYKSAYIQVDRELRFRKIENPNKYGDLWEWYGRCSARDLGSWVSRRAFISELYNPLVLQIQHEISERSEPTGWLRVDRVVDQMQKDIAIAATEEQYQSIGLLCRETLISLAQAIYNPQQHPSLDNITPSETDAKRMLEAYIFKELEGGANDEARKYVRSALDLANKLQHDRTAIFRDAALCLEATKSVVNVMAMLAGRRGLNKEY